jgi:hypothetical protein
LWWAPEQTARHFAEGTRVVHGEYGVGTIVRRPDGSLIPRFDEGSAGTTMTRVRSAS